MHVSTRRGSVEFDGNSVIIRPPRGLGGILSGKSAMSIPLRAIRYVEFSEPSGMKAGYFRINTGQPPLTGTAMRPAFMAAKDDPHSIIFTRAEHHDFAQLKSAIEAGLS